MARRRTDGPPVLILHIGWARDYRGDADDPVTGTFGYIADGNPNPGETLNFKPYRGKCYGYAAQSTLNLARLGGSGSEAHIDGVLVVFTATNPDASGRYVVGWFRNARVYPELVKKRPDRLRPDVLCRAEAGDCHVVPVDERSFTIPAMQAGWPGISIAFYASDNLPAPDLARIVAYVGGEASDGFPDTDGTDRPKVPSLPWGETDPEVRRKVWVAAVRHATAHYEAKGWQVENVESENRGWDLNVRRGRRLLLVEVKGRGNTGAVVITANEFRAMTDDKTRTLFRLAIVHEALSSSPRLNVFQYAAGSRDWVSEDGKRLSLEPFGAIGRIET